MKNKRYLPFLLASAGAGALLVIVLIVTRISLSSTSDDDCSANNFKSHGSGSPKIEIDCSSNKSEIRQVFNYLSRDEVTEVSNQLTSSLIGCQRPDSDSNCDYFVPAAQNALEGKATLDNFRSMITALSEWNHCISAEFAVKQLEKRVNESQLNPSFARVESFEKKCKS